MELEKIFEFLQAVDGGGKVGIGELVGDLERGTTTGDTCRVVDREVDRRSWSPVVSEECIEDGFSFNVFFV